MSWFRQLVLLGVGVLMGFSWQGAAQAQTPMPGPSVPPTPVATATPLPPQWQSIDFGVPVGNAYSPQSLAVDEANRLAYVFSARVPEMDGRSHGAISVVDLDRGVVVRRLPLMLPDNSSGWVKLAITRGGQRGYLLDRFTNILYTYDPHSHSTAPGLVNVLDFSLSPDEQHVVVQRRGSMAIYSPNLRTLRWRLFNDPQHFAVSNTALLVEDRNELGEHLTLYELDNGVPMGQVEKPGQIDALARGPDDSWYVAFRETDPMIWQLDSGLAVVAEATGLSGISLVYDEYRARLIASGIGYGADGDFRYLLRTLQRDDLQTVGEHRWPDWTLPDHLVVMAGAIAGIYTNDERDRLYLLDPKTLAPATTTALGVRLEEIVVDSDHGRLYIADNQNRIHSVDLTSGEILDVWEGMPPLALDEAQGRLYVNRYDDHRRRVIAIDVESGDVVAQFPQGGTPVVDARRDLVYIVDDGVSVYDSSGAVLGRLDSTFPDPAGYIPNPHAVHIAINPVNGTLFVFMHNGVPGSNSRISVSVYPAPAKGTRIPADQPVYVPNSDTVAPQIAFDGRSGDAFLTYGGFRGVTAIQRIGSGGEILDEVGGRTGTLYYDSTNRSLFVQEKDLLAQFNADLELVDFLLAPIDLDLAVYDEQRGEFFYQATWQGPVVVHHRLDELAHLSWENAGNYRLDALPDQRVSQILIAEHGEQSPVLFVTLMDGSLFQSTAGGGLWRQLYLGTLATQGYLAEALDGSLFYTGGSFHGGDGVFRSEDGGESWHLLNEGLANLHGIEAIQTVDPDRLYLVTTQQQLHRWDRTEGEWVQIRLPADLYLGAGQFQVAPDGALYVRSYSQVHRSTDGGETWQVLAAPPESIEGWQFAADFAQSQIIYGVVNRYADGGRTLYRSNDGGVSWQPVSPGYFWPVTSAYTQLALFAGDGALFAVETDGTQLLMVYRSLDHGDHWQQVADATLPMAAQAPQLAAGNQLWFIEQREAAFLDLDDLRWEMALPAMPTPAPGAGSIGNDLAAGGDWR